MEYQAPKSTCNLCGSTFARQGMARHVSACLKKHMAAKTKGKPQALIHLQVNDTYNPDYFLHLLLPEKAPLAYLDEFLRDIWLECCGHLSAFSFERYGDEIDMRYKIKDIFAARQKVAYQYDFGSTTELIIQARGRYQGPFKKGEVQIITRNAQPIIPCDDCDARPAIQICTECMWNDAGWLCEACAESHECDEDMFLPVVNSPRTGVCGYTSE